MQRAKTSVERRFHGHGRLKRRLPPLPDRPGTSDLFKICGPYKIRDPALAVLGRPLQPSSNPKGIYQGPGGGRSLIPYLDYLLLIFGPSQQQMRADLEKVILTLEVLG